MPVYKISELQEVHSKVGPSVAKIVVGELMKVGIVTYRKGEGPPPHFHPNEEQFNLILEGRRIVILGDEERVVGPGDLIHIPRNTRHGTRALDEKTVFLAVKSPAGTGELAQDYNKAADAEEVVARMEKGLKEAT